MEDANDTQRMMPLRIAKATDAAVGIRSFELVHPDGDKLPAFTPGSHVKVQVPNNEFRKYSLCGDPEDLSKYVITVKRDANGRGGSMSLVDEAKEGDTLPTSLPDNAFPLVEKASAYTFIAGGIGITPILSMIRSFGELPPAPWKLYYLSQSAETTAFLDVLNAPEWRKNVKVHHDGGDPDDAFDLWPVLEKPNRGHVYCCGPRGLMEAVRDMTGHWSPGNIHFESFLEGGEKRADDTPFTVRLARSGLEFEIPVGQSILSVLRAAEVKVPFSCESGTCGSCRTGLLEGVADHRDMVLMPEQQDNQIMVCVSRAVSDPLVLDL
jgi:phthalate 4,5-dioxygenase reductase subunit